MWQPSPVSSSPPKRRENGDGGIDAGEDVGIGDADLLRLALGLAGQVHDAAHALDHQVVAGAMRIGAVLPKPGDRAIDEPRIDLSQALVVESVLLQSVDLEVLDEHIGMRSKPPHQRPPLLRLEIGGDRALAAVGGVEVGGGTLFAVLSLDERGAPGARIVAFARALHLDYIGAKVGQQLPGPRPGEHACELQHAKTMQRANHRLTSSGSKDGVQRQQPSAAPRFIKKRTTCAPQHPFRRSHVLISSTSCFSVLVSRP